MIGNLLRAALFLGLLAAAAGIGATANAQTLALVGGKVYASPDAAPLDDAVVLTANGVIAAIGSRSDVQIPSDARVIDCTGKTVVAGFWNSHVHFTEAVWRNAGSAPAAPLTAHMQEMLTRWGFTTVWDLGSDPDNSMALRRRVYADEILGPNIFLVGSIFPRDGHPAYLPPDAQLPEAATPERGGGDGANYMRHRPRRHQTVHRRVQGRRQARREHGRGHRQGRGRCRARARQAGVRPSAEYGGHRGRDRRRRRRDGAHGRQAAGLSLEQLARFKQQGTALTPTLVAVCEAAAAGPRSSARLVDNDRQPAQGFSENGNTVLFGTDVGFITLYDTTLEYQLMHRALSERQCWPR